MGFNWGFNLKSKKDEDFNLYLISFCGWNSQTIYNRLKDFGTQTDDEGGQFTMNIKDLCNWGNELHKIANMFAKYSNRDLDNENFTDETWKAYYDLCYDLDIEEDSFNITTLRALDDFILFLQRGDLFNEYLNGTDYYLELNGSW